MIIGSMGDIRGNQGESAVVSGKRVSAVSRGRVAAGGQYLSTYPPGQGHTGHREVVGWTVPGRQHGELMEVIHNAI